MFGIIYGLENLIDHKIYIGQTHRTLAKRFSDHKYAKTLIGCAIRKYGEENFVKVILEECENQEQLDDCEIKWIARLNCMDPNGYNLTAGGAHGRNFKVSDSTRAKISAIHKGRKRPKSTCQKIAIALKGNKNGVGKKLSEEHIQKIVATHKGKPLTDEHKKKLSDAHKGKTAWNKGKKTPPEIRAKLSVAKKGKSSPKKGTHLSEETHKKLSEINTGKHHSEETRAKISSIVKVRWEKLKENDN